MDEIISPSGKFILKADFKTLKIYNQETSEIVYSTEMFHRQKYNFFSKNGQDWVMIAIKGTNPQIFPSLINLETGEHFLNSNSDYRWCSIKISPDEKTLAVDGCEWAAPYETFFVDISQIVPGKMTDWPILEITGMPADLWFAMHDVENTEWLPDGTFVYHQFTDSDKETLNCQIYARVIDGKIQVNQVVRY